jgi:DNA helicase-2/ATP-dependent DNA helicase PcrA
MSGLNPAQADAVHTLRGPMLVLAGAGSGKTRVVTFRIAELIRTGTRPSRILAVTFTNKAAAEMQERCAALLKQKKGAERPEISTFHSLCVRVLRRHATNLGYPAQFAIYDRGDQESIARSVLREIRVEDATLRPGDLLFLISNWKSHSLRPDDATRAARTDKEHLASMAYRRYQKALHAAGAVDFDDLLLCTEDLFQKFPDIRRSEAGRFDQVLVDEYQDTNGSQYRIIKALALPHRNLCVVGDDDQSIYGWRGADVTHILRFKQDWPEAKVVRLEDNYRSTEAILTLANRVIAYNKDRHDKTLRAARPGGEKPRIVQCQSEEDESEKIITDIRSQLSSPGVEPRDIAILFRTNEQPRVFEMELRRHRLPYVLVGGMSFYDRKEVRDVLAYLKVVARPSDEVSLLRIINTPPRGIGQKTVETLLAEAVQSGRSIWEVMHEGHFQGQQSSTTRDGMHKLTHLIDRYRQKLAHGSLAEMLSELLSELHYQDELRRLYPEPEDQQARWAAVGEVVNSLALYEQKRKNVTLQGFLDHILTGQQDAESDKDSQLARNAIALMTLHSAKGLEFPHVYLVGMEEGLLPHHRAVASEGAAIDEERRLCYVGITRAQERLTFSLALSRMKWGKPRPTDPSRFLFEITGQAESGQRKPQKSATKKKPAPKR